MKSLKETSFYRDSLHVLSYDFGDFYLYDRFIIAEFNDGEVVSWDCMGRILVDDIRGIYGDQSKELIYISNRINKYSVVPSDWIKFKRNECHIKGYGIISYSNRSYLNALLEKLFVSTKLQFFNSLESAISWACQVQKCNLPSFAPTS
ncbi:MAG: hypothetical protein ACR2MT_14870 [Aurantibacter sp.]